MTKLYHKISLLAFAFVLLAAIIVAVCLAPSADADGVTYVVATLEFDRAAYVGSDYTVKANVWTSTDKSSWQVASAAALSAEVVYYRGDVRLGAKPTEVGAYIVKLELGASCPDGLQNTLGNALGQNSVLATLSYRVVDKGVSVVFAPASDINYDSAVNSHDSIVAGTKVYLDGEDVTAAATVKVQDGGYTDTDTVTLPGEYHVLVSYEGQNYVSTFYVRRAIADVIALKSDVLYAGMHTSYNRGAANPAAEKAAMLENRTAYYTPKFAGSMADANGKIKAAYSGKIQISYWQGSLALTEAPIESGDYICRVKVTQNIGDFDLSAGDYVDLPYTIKATPYQAEWNKTIDPALGTMYVKANPSGVGVRVSRFVMTADTSRNLELSVGNATYFDANGQALSAEAVQNGLTELGRYSVLYEIDLSRAPGGIITGRDYFGDDDADFTISASNCWVQCEFEIIGAYKVEGARSVYYSDVTQYAKNYIQNYNKNHTAKMYAVDSLSPVVRYNSVAGDAYYTVTYTYNGSDKFEDDSDVNLTNIRAKKAVGHYEATITFGDWVGKDSNNQPVQVTTDGETFHFAFDIVTVPHDDLATYADDSAAAVSATGDFVQSLGIAAADADIAYYKIQNGMYANAGVADVCSEVGEYAAYIQVNAGEYKGQSFVYQITKRSTSTIESIEFRFSGLNGSVTDYTGTAIAAAIDFGDDGVASTLAYSLYYQQKEGDVWTTCAYPVNPGTYRAVLRFNEPCVYFSAPYGTTIIKEFTIRALPLTAVARFAGSSVYDGADKDVEITFYVAGRPLGEAAVSDFHYDIYYAKASDDNPTYVAAKPMHADLYSVGLVFTAGDYRCYGYTTTDKTPAEIWTANNSYAGYLLRTDNTLRLDTLLLDAVVTVPVGYHALYTGESVLPTVAFYQGNGHEAEAADVDAIRAEAALPTYSDDFATYFSVESARTAFGSNIKVEDTAPIETGKYDRAISLKAVYSGDIAFGRVAVSKDGAEEGKTYAVAATVVEGSENEKMNIAYSVNALPIRLEILENCFAERGDSYVAYYGEAHRRTTDDIRVYTVNRDGDVVPLVTPDLKQYVSMHCYTRLSGNNALGDEAVVGEDNLYAKGSYTIRIAFQPPASDEVMRTYSHYSLTGGTNTAAEGLLAVGCYYDVAFDVLQAEAVRVVFDAQFDSYTYDGTYKSFAVRFMSGDDDVSADFVPGVDYRLTYGDSEYSNAIGSANVDTAYSVKVTFLMGSYHYYVMQYVGEYSDAAEELRYIRAGSTVTYQFVVTRLRYLSWAWNGADGATSFYYRGAPIEHKVSFVSDTTYNAHAASVSLVRGTDYDVWYYVREGDQYVKLLSAPTAPGSYLAELVLLHDHKDYRCRIDSQDVVAYGYVTADTNFVPGSVVGSAGYYFGRSLASSGVVLGAENRYFAYTIARPTLRVSALSAVGKVFDNDDTAVVTTPYKLTALDGATVVDADVAGLQALLTGSFFGQFATVAVGENIPVYYRLSLGENYALTMPHEAVCMAQGVSGIQYMLQQLDAFDLSGAADAEKTRIGEVRDVIEALSVYYDIYFENVKADITKDTITVATNNYARIYDPDFDDSGVLTYTLSDADMAKLRALMPAATAATDFFVGSLSRENADVYAINEAGYPIVAGPDFAFVNTAVTLSDGNASTLATLYNVRVSRALYYINPCPITVGVEDNLVTAIYGDEDQWIDYKVVAGSLRDGDTLVYDGLINEQRTHSKEIDDVGTYAILYNKLKIFRYGMDVTANYRIAYRAATFEIKPLEVILTPVYGKAVYYKHDDFVPTEVGVSKRVGNNVIGFTDLSSKFHSAISYTFGQVEVANSDPAVYKRYNVTLGTIRVIHESGVDMSYNYIFSLGVNTKQFVMMKYVVRIAAVGELPSKHYGEADPHVELEDYNNSLAGFRFHLAEGSEPSREPGEEKGIYKYLSTNESGAIRVLNEDDEDVTQYCNITIYNGTQYLHESDFVLNINEMNVVVTVRNETVSRTGRSILPEVIYLNAESNTAVSSALIAQMKVKFVIPSDWKMNEGENYITPVVAEGYYLEDDPNFIYTLRAGVVNVIYPNNMVTVKALSQDDSTATANRYAFVQGKLYRTLQIYAANTMNGESPNRTVTVSLPVTETLFGEDVYLIAVHTDGSYSLREAEVHGTEITISDDDFYYIMAAQPETWPYYLLAGVVALIIIAVVVTVLRVRHRVKVRGKKERKVKEKKAKPVAPVPVTPKSDEYAVPELPDEEQDDDIPEEDAAPKDDASDKKKEKNKPNKEKKEKNNKGKDKKNKPQGGYVPGMSKPASPSAAPAPVGDGDTLTLTESDDTLPTEDDEIKIGASSKTDADTLGDLGAGDADDDEIVIAGSSRRMEETSDDNDED